MNETDARIAECLNQKRSFVLDAGAGSGKTQSLVTALEVAIDRLGLELCRRGQRIACITYTKVARDEIKERIKHSPLVSVSTIHTFLWNLLSGHQRALQRALVKLNDALPPESRRKRDAAQLNEALQTLTINYSEAGSNYLEGRLFHDDVLEIAGVMVADNPLLAQIVATQYPYILVDEYQDTSPAVIALLIDGIVARNPGRVVVGLFGDKLQHIYDAGVGELSAAHLGQLEQIIKSDNYRCSVSVIALLNRLRRDIQQKPGQTNGAVAGDAIYIRVRDTEGTPLKRVRAFVQDTRGWTATPASERELYLTHRLISKKGGYDRLLSIFDDRGGFYRDRLLTGEEPRIAVFLGKLEPLATAWEAGKEGSAVSLLRQEGFALTAERTKTWTAAALTRLVQLRGSASVGEVLRHILATNLLPLPDDMRDRLQARASVVPDTDEAREREVRDAAFFGALFALPYSEVISFAAFFEEHTPYSTQHGVKGAEFETVYVVLDDKGARWNMYSFEKYLTGEDEAKNPVRLRKTRNILYVCCSRSMRNLAVVDFGGSNPKKDGAVRALFGADKCFEV